MTVPGVVDGLFRRSAGRLVAVLAARLGPARLDLAEEAVQDALLRALETWPHAGVPENPEAWLFRVARNRAMDRLRRSARHDRALEVMATAPEADDGAGGGGAADELRLLLLCCHPALSPRARVALALKTVGGFGVGEIARAYLSRPEAVAQLLVRAKRTVREEGLALDLPDGDALLGRLESALETLYLVFNEGYSATEGDRAVREDLCVAAIRLAELFLTDPLTERPELHALLALMLLQASRLRARIGPDGALRLLDDQPREEWDREMIAAGLRHFERASTGPRLTVWHVEAAIASVHAVAARAQDTDWERVLSLYDDLLQLKPSPVVRMNRAVALGRVRGPAAALAELDAAARHPAMKRYYLLQAARADCLLSLDDPAGAGEALSRALEHAGTEPERRLLRMRLARLVQSDGVLSPGPTSPNEGDA